MEQVEDKVDEMIQSRPGFRRATKKFFEMADKDGTGRVSQREAASQVSLIFDEIQRDLDDFGITVAKPSAEDVMEFMLYADDEGDCDLDFEEFEDFYLQVVKLAALKSAQGFLNKYGWSMVAGIFAVHLAKRAVRSIPIVGLLATPFMALVPSVLTGPFLGLAARYGLDKGDLLAAKKKLFPSKDQRMRSERD